MAQQTGNPMQIAQAQLALEQIGQQYQMAQQMRNRPTRSGSSGRGGVGSIMGYLAGMGG
jgi:hypothetical protein